MLFRLLFAVIAGLVGAALLHVVIILSLPHFTGRDAYNRIIDAGVRGTFIAAQDGSKLADVVDGDPYLKVAACAFTLDYGPVRLSAAKQRVPFWSLSVFDEASNEIFSMNDRTSVAGGLDMVLASAAQLSVLRKALPEELAQSILVEMTGETGYAVLRSAAPRPSFNDAAAAFLSDATCKAFALP